MKVKTNGSPPATKIASLRQRRESVTSTIVAMWEWLLAEIGNIADLLHTPYLLFLLGETGTKAWDVRLLPHSTTRV